MSFWSDVHRIVSRRVFRRVALAFLVLLAPVFLFAKLAEEVRERETLPVDEMVLRGINSHASPQLDALAVVLTQLGSLPSVSILTIGIGLLLWGRQRRKMAVLLVMGVGGATALNLLLKAIFQRDRPHLWERLVTENSYSFPSGHAMASSALAFSLIVIFWPTRWRWLVIVCASLYMVAIGLTRLYLGVHYPSDVLAGWAISAAWIGAMVYALTYRSTLWRIFFKKQPHDGRIA